MGLGKYRLAKFAYIKLSAICLLQVGPKNIHKHVARFHGIQDLQILCDIFSDEITLQAHKEENGFTNNPGMCLTMSSCKSENTVGGPKSVQDQPL